MSLMAARCGRTFFAGSGSARMQTTKDFLHSYDGSLRRDLPALSLRLPLLEERLETLILHVAGVLKLALVLGVEQLAVGIEDSEGGDAFLERYAVLSGDVQVLIEAADVDVHDHVVLFDQGGELGLAHLGVERVAVAAPVGAEIQHDVLVASSSLGDGRADELLRVRLFIVDSLPRSLRPEGDSGERQERQGTSGVIHAGSFHIHRTTAMADENSYDSMLA